METEEIEDEDDEDEEENDNEPVSKEPRAVGLRLDDITVTANMADETVAMDFDAAGKTISPRTN
jgi:hypothetical protein